MVHTIDHLSTYLPSSLFASTIAEREGGGQEGGREPVKRVRTQRHCGRCGETGHNARTCAVEIEDPSDSYESE